MFKRADQFTYTHIAGEDLSDRQFCFVKLNASNQIVLASDGDVPFGILTNPTKQGERGIVVTYGGGQNIVNGANLETGKPVVVTGNGRGITVEFSDPRPKVGICKKGQSANGELGDIDLEFLGGGDNIFVGTTGAAVTRFLFVKLDSSGEVVQCDTADENPLGIALHNAGNGSQIAVATVGARATLTSSAAVALHVLVATTTTGKGGPGTASKGIGAIALQAASGADENIPVIVTAGTA